LIEIERTQLWPIMCVFVSNPCARITGIRFKGYNLSPNLFPYGTGHPNRDAAKLESLFEEASSS